MRRGHAGFTLAFIAGIALAGCGGGVRPPISGKVLLDNSPLADAEILFEKRDKEGVAKFDAKTDAEGKFEVPRIAGRTVAPGKYQVLITKWVDQKGKVTAPEDIEQLRAAGTARNVVPEKYSDPGFSPLFAEIKEGKTELPPFELKGK